MSSPLWFIELLKRFFPYSRPLARMTRLPVIGPLVDHALFEDDDVMILPQDDEVSRSRAITVDRPVALPTNQVLPSQVVEHFIESAEHLWIMSRCICRDASGCEHYPRDLGCLFLGEATLDINPKLGRPVGVSEALAHARRARDLGLVHMIGRSKFDTVWLNVGPGRKLMTICNCCDCCCLTRVLPHVNEHISAKITRTPGVVVQVDEELCQGCNACQSEVCFVDAIARTAAGQARITAACRGCGRCVRVCPAGAIKLEVEDPAFVERSIARLTRAVEISPNHDETPPV